MNPADSFCNLNKSIHDRKTFDCGEDEINHFLKTQAAIQMKNNLSVTQVLPSDTLKWTKFPICAFFTVAVTTVDRATFPEKITKKLPHYPTPVFLIAQMGVHVDCQRQNLGRKTLAKAMNHLWNTNSTDQRVKGYAIIVDCLNERVIPFYKKFGFEYLCQHHGRTRLYIPMKIVDKLFSEPQ